MPYQSLQFTLLQPDLAAEIRAKIEEFLSHSSSESEQVDIVCMDSFDWLLQGNRVCVESQRQGRHYLLTWREFGSSQALFTSQSKTSSFFAHEIPLGRFQDKLRAVIKIRKLLPQLKFRLKRNVFSQLNSDNKTILRVVLLEYQLYNKSSRKFLPLENRIEIAPIRGYEKSRQAMLQFVNNSLNVIEAKQDIVDIALCKLGIDPSNYRAGIKLKLTPQMRPTIAVHWFVKSAFNVMRLTEQGVMEDIDSEYLHDYRVSMRKMRSVLKLVKNVLAEKESAFILTELAWLSNVTGPVRDMDVYLLKYENYKSLLPIELQPGLVALHELLLQKKDKASDALVDALQSTRYSKYKNRMIDILELAKQAEQIPRLEQAEVEENVKTVADKRIWKMYKRVLREGGAIGLNSPAEELHELRKSCKKLRYLIELFQSLYSGEGLRQVMAALKMLQSNLGEYNDLNVQVEHLQAFEKELKKQKHLANETHLAISFLVRSLNQLMGREREKFSAIFHEFSLPERQREFKALFNSS